MPVDLSGGTTIIALSLRCLVLAHDLYDVLRSDEIEEAKLGEGFPAPLTLSNTTLSHKESSPRFNDEGTEQSIRAWKYLSVDETDFEASKVRLEIPLEMVLKGLVQLTQRMLFRRALQNWPALFSVLCVLRLVARTVTALGKYTHIESDLYGLYDTWSDLCDLYQFCAKGFHPLTKDWDTKTYESLASGNNTAIQHFNRMNQMWIARSTLLSLPSTTKKQNLRNEKSLISTLSGQDYDEGSECGSNLSLADKIDLFVDNFA